LSALWLSERSQGTSDAEYLQKVGDWKNNPTYNKAQMLWKNQLDYEKLGFFPHFLGLDVARRPDGSEKQKQASFKKDLQFSADLKHRKENEFHDQTDPRGLVEWLKLKKPRYFMISVERADHAVAAAYDKQGLSFFDPNGGIMTCNAEAMTKALYWYFAHPKLHEVYAAKLGLKPGQTTLLATKYKKGKKALGSYGKAISAGTEAAGAIAGGNPQVALPEVTTTPTNLEGGAALRGN
jgi:hypothetical protein